MDQGIIRSFKAYYSQEMLHAIYCWRLKNKDGNKNSIDNRDLWICIANAWRKVTKACIRNCFAKAPILSNPQSNDLKELGTESAQHQVETLQQELIEKYRHLEDEIASQNDIGVLNYLDMIYSDGPDDDMLSAIQETMAKDEFKSLFLEHSIDLINDIDEDDEETEDKEEDSDFEISDASQSDNDHGEPTLALRSKNTYFRYFRDKERLSPPSSPLDEEYLHCSKESLIESLDQLKSNIPAMPDMDRHALRQLVFVRRASD
ncbi:hypothetical protein BGX24_004774 [Mortierella sp. AD032]|nr:hypothetical protein BGX24_004774 [Mortierella sp. AD032]